MLKQGKVLIIHGGGLVDCSKQVLLRIALQLYNIFEDVYLGHFSFEALYNKKFWERYTPYYETTLQAKRGTYFGTCRDIIIEGDKLVRAIKLLKKEGITTIVVCGGDGSARQVHEMYQEFEKVGINIVFAVPLTIDGINGGVSLGIEQARIETVRQIENMAATSLETRDNEKFGVLCAEIQGRNRDDITAETLKYFDVRGKVADRTLDELNLIVVPANIKTVPEKLYKAINSSEKRTLVLLSEGAEIKISDIKANTNRKVRSVVIGHQSQSNNHTTVSDLHIINDWAIHVRYFMEGRRDKSFCIRKEVRYCGDNYSVESIDYYAKLNPRKNQITELPEELKELICSYMEK